MTALCFFCTMTDGSSRPEGHDGPHGAVDELNGAMLIETLDDLRAALARLDAVGVSGTTRVQVLIHDVDFMESEGDDEYRASYCAAIDAAGAVTDEGVIMIWPSNPAVRRF